MFWYYTHKSGNFHDSGPIEGSEKEARAKIRKILGVSTLRNYVVWSVTREEIKQSRDDRAAYARELRLAGHVWDS